MAKAGSAAAPPAGLAGLLGLSTGLHPLPRLILNGHLLLGLVVLTPQALVHVLAAGNFDVGGATRLAGSLSRRGRHSVPTLGAGPATVLATLRAVPVRVPP